MDYIYNKYDVVVIGAGHAGCEAALAAARLGMHTLVFTVSVDSIAMMPCNPNIGGTSKGHLVREIDALGGEMGKNIDKTFIQSKMLNTSKGPAVHSLRAQADKKDYSRSMRRVLENTDNLVIKQGEVAEVLVENNKVTGVRTTSNAVYPCDAVIMCTGTYLQARCIYGDVSQYTGPNGLAAANELTKHLMELGIEVRRFKTGTPARVDKRTIDFSKMAEQTGDEKIVPFSFTNTPEDLEREQVSCWLTYTNKETHKIIMDNIDRSPLYSGNIKGTGPRYCPSIEDKVVRFADKERHQVFLEPEGNYTNEMYIGGMSSSLPEDVQIQMYHTVPGLEHAEIVRNVHAHGAGHSVAAAGAADFDVAAQDVGSLPDGGVLGVGHGAEISEGGEVVAQLVFCAHAGEDDLHIFVAGRPAQRPRGRAGVGVQCIQRRGSVRRQLCQRTALDGLHDDEGNIQFFGKSIAPVACDLLGTVIGVEVVVLQLAEVPRLVAKDVLEARRVVVAGEAKIPDAPGSFLLPEPVHNAHLFGHIVAGFVQGMQQIEVDVVHAQPLELLLEDVFGLVEGLAAPHRQLGGEVEALPRPLGNDPAHERFALTAVVGESGVKVVDARLPGSVQQLFGPHFVDAAIRQGGKAHTPVA